MSVHISPSILGADFADLKSSLKETEKAGADSIHFDIMDRHFVPNLTFGPFLMKILREHSSLPFYAHLMVDNADDYIDECILSGASGITVHAEACTHLQRTLSYIKSKDCIAGVAVNPATSLSFFPYIADVADEILIMTVNPGFSGQKFIPAAMGKIGELYEISRKMNKKTIINVDGGINLETAREAIALGASSLVMASAFYGSADPKKLVEDIKKIPLR